MNRDIENPSDNCLPPGIGRTLLEEAVRASGYPLQTRVAKMLGDAFGVTEEWSYIDGDSQIPRNLDLFAYKRLTQDPKTEVQASLALLVECKRSEFPFVFFPLARSAEIPGFPVVTGLPNPITVYETESTRSQWVLGGRLLGLAHEAFVTDAPAVCATMAKLEGRRNQPAGVAEGGEKGAQRPREKGLRLSGEGPFREVILPLSKAIAYAHKYYRGRKGQDVIFPMLIFGICVVDAAMVVVRGAYEQPDLELTPWVRVVREESPKRDQTALPKSKKYNTIDVVHIAYLKALLDRFLLPIGDSFVERARRMEPILRNGSGIVQKLDHWTWEDIRVRPVDAE